MAESPKNKEAWLKLLKQTSLPSFSSSVNALSNIERYSQKHASELARTILKDPNLTASVLKLANSAHFNASGNPIRTVSRSIMVLGHKSVKEVCASCLLIDSFMKKGASKSLKALLGRAFHAAVQAKQIAYLHGEKSTEEIFISALLMNLGEISVYSAVDEKSDIFHQLIKSYPLNVGKEKELIGCYFNDLTMGLCDAWHIAPMIHDVVKGNYAENSPLRSILLGSSLAQSSEVSGLNSAVSKHLKSITRFTGKTPETVTEKIVEACEETQQSLHSLGLKLDVNEGGQPTQQNAAMTKSIRIDKILQLDVIQELAQLSEESFDINDVLQHILEGIKRGAGFSNALVALLSPDKSRLAAKHAIGQESSQVKESFNFSCYHNVPEIHQKVLTNRYVIRQTELREQGMTLKQIKKRTGTTYAIWGPLVVENKVIGCFYADNGIEGGEITEEQKQAFKLFICQARLHLQKLK